MKTFIRLVIKLEATFKLNAHKIKHDNCKFYVSSQEFIKTMDRAPNGIIYFSLGANIKSSELPMEKLEVFLKIFESMNDVLVLWKFESVALRERHFNNIIIGPWLPQQEILKHKNLKVFITHGGLLSMMEAVQYGRPIIGMPFFNNEKLNVARAVSQGHGVMLDYDTLSEDSLRRAIGTIYNDTSYQTNAEKLSEVFRDNPIKAIDKAVYYVEHVIRAGGAAHLKTAATKLSLCQIHLVDQVVFVLTAIASIILIAIFVLSKGMKWLKSKFQKRCKSGSIKGAKRNKFKSN